jgi:geranylgeranyl pyrophosphate synthase
MNKGRRREFFVLGEVLLPIREELEQVQNILNEVFKIKTGNLIDFLHPDLSSINNFSRPALVILSARLFTLPSRQVIFLAAIVQFIYMAFQVHKSVTEDESQFAGADNHRNDRQFLVLVGDYFYSRFFAGLCDAGLLKYLRPLSELICQFNEGNILRLKNRKEELFAPDTLLKRIIEKESAAFVAASCRMGGELGGAREPDLKCLYHFGFNLGMSFGLLKEQASPDEAAPYFQKALSYLAPLPPGVNRDTMEQIACALQKEPVLYG